jgi:DNA-binding CsgD family transcriptional regulator
MWALDCKSNLIFANKVARNLASEFELERLGPLQKCLLPVRGAEGWGRQTSEGVWRCRLEIAGSERTFETSFAPIFDSDGVSVGVSAETVDLSVSVHKDETHWATATELEWQRAAFDEALRSFDQEKQKLREDVLANIEEAVLPSLMLLKRRYPDELRKISEIESAMRRSASLTAQSVLIRQYHLTTTECRIIQYIKAGFLDGEISESLKVSSSTLKKHKFSIRRKLGLENSEISLREGLKSLGITAFL